MVDPYATRARTHTGEAPPGPAPWEPAVAERGGALLGSLRDVAEANLAQAAFAAVACRGAGLLPAVARVTPAQAVALLITHGHAEEEVGGAAANDALGRLSAAGRDLYALKHGWVGGPEGSEGAVAVSAELVASVLDAAGAGAVEWERDPDFGYEAAAAVPGLEPPEADALRPRLLYAYSGRVYDHAALVPLIKRERTERLGRIEGLDPQIATALG